MIIEAYVSIELINWRSVSLPRNLKPALQQNPFAVHLIVLTGWLDLSCKITPVTLLSKISIERF